MYLALAHDMWSLDSRNLLSDMLSRLCLLSSPVLCSPLVSPLLFCSVLFSSVLIHPPVMSIKLKHFLPTVSNCFACGQKKAVVKKKWNFLFVALSVIQLSKKCDSHNLQGRVRMRLPHHTANWDLRCSMKSDSSHRCVLMTANMKFANLMTADMINVARVNFGWMRHGKIHKSVSSQPASSSAHLLSAHISACCE